MYPLRLVHDLRPALPWSIHELPINIPGRQPEIHARRIAIKWDEDNDERIFGALLDAYYRDPESIWSLYAVGERKAELTVWAAELSPERQVCWQKAADSDAIMDSWTVEFVDPYAEVARVGGMKTLQQLSRGDRRRHFTPEHDELNALIDLFKLGPTGPRREFS
jgi:hypothetical protein